MQAIITKVIPATNTKPTRIKASCERGSLTACEDASAEGSHRSVAAALCAKFAKEDEKRYGSPLSTNPWLRPFVTGQIPSGDYAHVFTA